MNVDHDLKTYLTAYFSNQKYKNISLLELYASDKKYYTKLVEKKKVDPEAVEFFYTKGNEIIGASKIQIEAVKKLIYIRIIDEYIAEKRGKPDCENDVIKETNIKNESADKNNIGAVKLKSASASKKKKKNNETMEKVIHCIYDYHELKLAKKCRATNKSNGRKIVFPMYLCPECNTKYTCVPGIPDKETARLNNVKYINIDSKYDRIRYQEYLQRPRPVKKGSCCYVYGVNKPGVCENCKKPGLINKNIQFRTKKNKTSSYFTKYCNYCDMYHLSLTVYKEHQEEWKLMNPEEIPLIEEGIQKRKEERARVRAERKEKRKAALQRQRELEEKLRQQELERIKTREMEARQAAKRLWEELETSRQKDDDDNNYRNLKNKKIYNHDNNIRVKDFVVRRSVFKCRHNDHKLQNIDGIIGIIDRKGNIVQTNVSGGYCPNCNVFFIMESTYQSLKRRGTPICRISDEKAYLSDSTYVNGMKLAQESVLKQYGYSVSQEENLTDLTRKKILSLLVDNKVLTRNEIISYLDFFINQRKYQPRYEKAIDKWKDDREFISNYRIGEYTQYGVKGIHRRY